MAAEVERDEFEKRTARNMNCGTELLSLLWTLSIVLYVEDKRPQRFGDWICLRPQVDGAG
jgi:hypothetical protein